MKQFSLLLVLILLPVTVIAGGFIAMPADQAYQSALEVAMDMDALPEKENEKLRYFTTEPVKKKLTEEECDCGSVFGIPYIKDKRTVCEITYKIRVKEVEGGSEISVKTDIVGYYDESKNKISKFMAHKERDKGKILTAKV